MAPESTPDLPRQETFRWVYTFLCGASVSLATIMMVLMNHTHFLTYPWKRWAIVNAFQCFITWFDLSTSIQWDPGLFGTALSHPMTHDWASWWQNCWAIHYVVYSCQYLMFCRWANASKQIAPETPTGIARITCPGTVFITLGRLNDVFGFPLPQLRCESSQNSSCYAFFASIAST